MKKKYINLNEEAIYFNATCSRKVTVLKMERDLRISGIIKKNWIKLGLFEKRHTTSKSPPSEILSGRTSCR